MVVSGVFKKSVLDGSTSGSCLPACTLNNTPSPSDPELIINYASQFAVHPSVRALLAHLLTYLEFFWAPIGVRKSARPPHFLEKACGHFVSAN